MWFFLTIATLKKAGPLFHLSMAYSMAISLLDEFPLPYNIFVSFIRGYHEAGVVELVGDVDVGTVAHQERNDVEPSLETGRSQRSGLGFRHSVNVGPG